MLNYMKKKQFQIHNVKIKGLQSSEKNCYVNKVQYFGIQILS